MTRSMVLFKLYRPWCGESLGFGEKFYKFYSNRFLSFFTASLLKPGFWWG